MIKKKLLTDKSGALFEEMMEASAKQLADDIDFEVLTSALIEGGWTKVVLSPMTYEHGQAVDSWMVDNCKGAHMTRGLVWVFEDKKDANWFSMRWLA